MKQTEIIELVGLKSTDPKLIAFFEKYGLKAPKTVNANSSGKAIRHKEYNIDFDFHFDIVNDAFYPPFSPKNNEYDFVAYLRNIYIYPSKKDIRPSAFWDVTPSTSASYEEFENYSGKIDKGYFKKAYSSLVEITTKYDVKKKKYEYISAGIIQEREIISYLFFNTNNEYNLWPEAYTFLIKWLFDNRFLDIDDKIYDCGLKSSHGAILEFVQLNLKNRLWKNQLKEIPNLFDFLNAIRSGNKVWRDNDKQQVILYQNELFLIATENFEQYKRLFYEDIDKADELCRCTRFTSETARTYLNLLSDRFEMFPKIKDLKVNN